MTDQSSATLGDTDYRGERTLIHMFPIIKVPPEKWMFLNFKSPENYGGGGCNQENLIWANLSHMGPGSNGLVALSHLKGKISFGPEVKSHLGQGPNLIWARGQISFQPGAESHFSQGLNLNWARGQISLGPGAESHLVEYWKIIPSPVIILNLDHVYTTFWLFLFFRLLLKMRVLYLMLLLLLRRVL